MALGLLLDKNGKKQYACKGKFLIIMLRGGAMSGKAQFKAVFIITLVILFTVFVLQNTAVVEIRLLFWELTVSRVLMLVGALAVGCLIGLLIGMDVMRRKRG
jgi:putative membrane protein